MKILLPDVLPPMPCDRIAGGEGKKHV